MEKLHWILNTKLGFGVSTLKGDQKRRPKKGPNLSRVKVSNPKKYEQGLTLNWGVGIEL